MWRPGSANTGRPVACAFLRSAAPVTMHRSSAGARLPLVVGSASSKPKHRAVYCIHYVIRHTPSFSFPAMYILCKNHGQAR